MGIPNTEYPVRLESLTYIRYEITYNYGDRIDG